MGDQEKKAANESSARIAERSTLEASKAKKYLIHKEILAMLEKKRQMEQRRARRYVVNTELVEVNGVPGQGSRIIDLSTNGARMDLPFSPPFMSQITVKFALQGSEKFLRVVGRVIWSKTALQRGRYEVGVQFYQNYWEIDHLLRLQPR
jgi:hypothetical protein